MGTSERTGEGRSVVLRSLDWYDRTIWRHLVDHDVAVYASMAIIFGLLALTGVHLGR